MGTQRTILSPFTKGCRVHAALMRLCQFFWGVYGAKPFGENTSSEYDIPTPQRAISPRYAPQCVILAGGAIALSMTPSGDVLIAS